MSRAGNITGAEAAGAQAEDLSARHLVSYTVGVTLAINAIRDAYLVVDGPDCVYMRTQFIQGNHDYLSTLTSVGGQHRVVNTALEPAQVMHGREQALTDLLTEIAHTEEAGGVLISSMPLAAVLGIDYGRLCRRAARAAAKPVIHVPGKSLSTDWLGGYEQSLAALAQAIELPDRERPAHRVAVVGLLYDRNEGDCSGNVAELTRLLEGLGLEVASIWLDGGGLAGLSEVSGAGTILSLPYGRRAARTLAQRLDARLVETELPFGLPATERWLRQVAEATERAERAEALIDTELARLVPKLEWVAPLQIEGRRFGYAGDPHLLPGFAQTIDLLGGRLAFAVVTNCAHHLTDAPALPAGDLLVEPRQATLLEFFDQRLRADRLDCLVTNGHCLDAADPRAHAVMEFGFPAYNVHALYPRPYLGFGGALAFVDSLANQVRLFQALSDVLERED